jgi:hypothetical protein
VQLNLPIISFQYFLQLAFKGIIFVHATETAFCAYKCLRLGFSPFNSFRWMMSVACSGNAALKLMPTAEGKKNY